MKNNILINSIDLQQRITQLAQDIELFYKDRDWVAVVVYNGAMFFASDLLKQIQGNFKIVGVQASSYKGGYKSGQININNTVDCKDRHVLIIDDIYDTGKTMYTLTQEFLEKGAITVEHCVLLTKDVIKDQPLDVLFSGFDIPNKFVFGYGLDINDRYRNQQYIAVHEYE